MATANAQAPAETPAAAPAVVAAAGSNTQTGTTRRPPTLKEVLTCARCKKLLQDPWALPCYHNFCRKCLSAPQKGEQQNGGGGVHCTVCETFAKPREFTQNYLISELLALYRLQASRGGAECSQCGLASVPIEYICVQCKLALCSGCRQRHLDIPVCRSHHVVPLTDPNNLRLDGPVNCPLHSDKQLDLNCVTCREVICEQCKTTRHKTHKTEPVPTALARTIEEIRTNLRKMAENDKVYQADMFKLDVEMDNMTTQFLTTMAQLTRAKEKLIQKINKDYALLMLRLSKRKRDEIVRINRIRYEIANKIRIRENVVSWMANCLKLANGTSLLLELQSSLQQRVSIVSNDRADGVNIAEHCSPMFVPRADNFSTADNVLGDVIYTPSNYPVPHELQLPFRELLRRKCTAESEIQVNGLSYQMALVNNALWLPISNKHQIKVFTLTGNLLNTIAHDDIREPLAIAQVREHDVTVASYSGLFLLDAVSGVIQTSLHEGQFCYVHSNGEIFAALEHQTKSVYIYQWFGPSLQWRIFKQMNFNLPSMGCLSTLLICDKWLYLCPWDGQTVYKYTLNGDLKCRYLNQQRDGGQLDYPRVCAVDRERSLLVVDEHYERLQLLTHDGKWREIELDGAKNPGAVLVLNNSTLFVLEKTGKFSTKVIRYHIPP